MFVDEDIYDITYPEGQLGKRPNYTSRGSMDFLVAQMVKNLPVVQETRVGSLSWEDPLEREMAAHFSILAWRILRAEEPGRLQSVD